jgi:hypothetical protein
MDKMKTENELNTFCVIKTDKIYATQWIIMYISEQNAINVAKVLNDLNSETEKHQYAVSQTPPKIIKTGEMFPVSVSIK